MVTHQQMLKEYLKHGSEKCQHPKNTRPKGDITLDSSGVVTKRPRVLGLKLSVRFGTELSSLANKDGTNKAIQHQGGLVRKRSCENILIPTKKTGAMVTSIDLSMVTLATMLPLAVTRFRGTIRAGLL